MVVFVELELIVEPRLWPRKRRGFLLTILVILPMVEAFGVWGLIMSPPVSAALVAVGGQAYQAYVNQRQTAVQWQELQTRYKCCKK